MKRSAEEISKDVDDDQSTQEMMENLEKAAKEQDMEASQVEPKDVYPRSDDEEQLATKVKNTSMKVAKPLIVLSKVDEARELRELSNAERKRKQDAAAIAERKKREEEEAAAQAEAANKRRLLSFMRPNVNTKNPEEVADKHLPNLKLISKKNVSAEFNAKYLHECIRRKKFPREFTTATVDRNSDAHNAVIKQNIEALAKFLTQEALELSADTLAETEAALLSTMVLVEQEGGKEALDMVSKVMGRYTTHINKRAEAKLQKKLKALDEERKEEDFGDSEDSEAENDDQEKAAAGPSSSSSSSSASASSSAPSSSSASSSNGNHGNKNYNRRQYEEPKVEQRHDDREERDDRDRYYDRDGHRGNGGYEHRGGRGGGSGIKKQWRGNFKQNRDDRDDRGSNYGNGNGNKDNRSRYYPKRSRSKTIASVFDKELKFVPTPPPTRSMEIDRASSFLINSVRRIHIYRKKDMEAINPFQYRDAFEKMIAENFKVRKKSGFMFPKTTSPAINEFEAQLHKDLKEIKKELELSKDDKIEDNLSARERQVAKKLKSDPSIVVKQSDKNLGLYIWKKADHDRELKLQLEDKATYEAVGLDRFNAFIVELTLHIRKATWLPEKNQQFLMQYLPDSKSRNPLSREGVYIAEAAKMHLIPKIHKMKEDGTVPGRLIAAHHSSPATPASTFLDELLRECLSWMTFDVQDSLHLIESLENTIVGFNKTTGKRRRVTFLSADVVAMYPSIRIDDLEKRIDHFIDLQVQNEEKRAWLKKLLRLILRNNFIQARGQIYRQINGVAMGISMSPTLARLYMGDIEHEMLEELREEKELSKMMLDHILAAKRYFDDALFMWCGGNLEYLQVWKQRYEAKLKSHGLLLEWKEPSDKVDFLDLTIFMGDRFEATGKLDYKLYEKPQNKYRYIPRDSFHPLSVLKGFIKGETIRHLRNCSQKQDFLDGIKRLARRLMKRKYSPQFIHKIMRTVKWEDRDKYLRRKEKNKQFQVPIFRIRYAPRLNSLKIRQGITKGWSKIAAEVEAEIGNGSQAVFSKHRPPMICYTKSPALNQLLCRPNGKE